MESARGRSFCAIGTIGVRTRAFRGGITTWNAGQPGAEKYDTRKEGSLYTAVAPPRANSSVMSSASFEPRAIVSSRSFLGIIALLIAVAIVGVPNLSAMDRIASCCGRYVDVWLKPTAFSCFASPALRCGRHYAIPGEAAVHARERPCLSEGGGGGKE
jgi:hypothetical protein